MRISFSVEGVGGVGRAAGREGGDEFAIEFGGGVGLGDVYGFHAAVFDISQIYLCLLESHKFAAPALT